MLQKILGALLERSFWRWPAETMAARRNKMKLILGSQISIAPKSHCWCWFRELWKLDFHFLLPRKLPSKWQCQKWRCHQAPLLLCRMQVPRESAVQKNWCHLGKRKITFKSALVGGMLVPSKVHCYTVTPCNLQSFSWPCCTRTSWYIFMLYLYIKDERNPAPLQ